MKIVIEGTRAETVEGNLRAYAGNFRKPREINGALSGRAEVRNSLLGGPLISAVAHRFRFIMLFPGPETYATEPSVFFGDEWKFGTITRSAKLYSTTRAVSGAAEIRAEKRNDGNLELRVTNPTVIRSRVHMSVILDIGSERDAPDTRAHLLEPYRPAPVNEPQEKGSLLLIELIIAGTLLAKNRFT